VGTMPFDERSPVAGLYRVDPDCSVTAILTGTTISNGLGWSPDGASFYFIDSPTRRVDVFACDPETGALEDRRPLAAVEVEGAVPDGMAVDAEGCLWVALHGGWGLNRHSPDGELLQEVRLPIARVTSCCFGGPQLSDLYVTTRREGLSAAEAAAQPLAGALLRLDPGVAGLPTNAFAG
jgi:sugar lactone lactonase YvrE